MFISSIEDGERTNPDNIKEWFSEEFMKVHQVYAIKEEEAFLLKIYTRDKDINDKTCRKRTGRKPVVVGEEVNGEMMVACGRCGYRSNEGSNVRRHLKRSVCVRDRGYTKEQLDGLNHLERQRFIRRVASAKFRAKKKLEALSHVNSKNSDEESRSDDGRRAKGRLKTPKKPHSAKLLTLGPVIEREAVPSISFDVFTVNEHNIRVAWKPPSCHKASSDHCQIVFKGARMKRRCLEMPLPILLTYRKLDCKIHHCNFTLFHPHARKAFKDDPAAKRSLNIRIYGDTVMTQEFYHHFVSLMSVSKMKSSQCARHLTGVWETILMERLNTESLPDESRKIITLSKQTVKSVWSNIEEERGQKNGFLQTKAKKKKAVPVPIPHIAPSPVTHNPTFAFPEASLPPQLPLPLSSTHETHSRPNHPHPQHISNHLIPQPQQQEYQHQHACVKRYTTHTFPKFPSGAIPTHTLPIASHSVIQGPIHPHNLIGGTPVSQTHPCQYSTQYSASTPTPQDDYYSVHASFIPQYAPNAVIGTTTA